MVTFEIVMAIKILRKQDLSSRAIAKNGHISHGI